MTKQKSNAFTDIASFFLAIYYFWYELPFMRITFSSERFKHIFFACFVAGVVSLCIARMIHRKMRIFISARISLLTPVLVYMAVLSVMYIFRTAEAASHIRVSFTFWGTLLVYCLFSFDRRAQIRFGQYLLSLFLLTVLTSVVAVVSDNSAARAIANASQRTEAIVRDYALMRKNVSGIYLFQCMVIFAPVPVLMLRRQKKALLGLTMLIFIFLAVFKASFTISLFVLVLVCAVAVISNCKDSVKLLLPIFAVAVMLLPMDSLFSSLADIIENRYISTRFSEIAAFLNKRSIQGDLQLRLQCYLYSLHTFVTNPFGIGPWYSYRIGEHGIGYHSALLDDMARYGVFALAFYGTFLMKYCQMLQEQWKKLGLGDAVLPMLFAWFMFLLLNIAFRSADESIFMLYILPILPDILLRHHTETEGSI